MQDQQMREANPQESGNTTTALLNMIISAFWSFLCDKQKNIWLKWSPPKEPWDLMISLSKLITSVRNCNSEQGIHVSNLGTQHILDTKWWKKGRGKKKPSTTELQCTLNTWCITTCGSYARPSVTMEEELGSMRDLFLFLYRISGAYTLQEAKILTQSPCRQYSWRIFPEAAQK